MQSQLIPTSIRASRSTIHPRDLEPGLGTLHLHIGQSESQVLELWNEPTRRVRQGDSLYLIYTSLAMQVELQKGQVERLFFLRPRSSSLELRVGSKEIIYGMSRAQILRKFGKPEEQGKGRTILGKYVRGWLCYPTGVQFEFGKSGKLELITIFRPGIDTPK